MGLLIAFAVMSPVIVFWAIVTFEVFKRNKNKKPRLLAVGFLFTLLIAPFFMEYSYIERNKDIFGSTDCGRDSPYDSDANSFTLTETINNDIIEITKRDGQ